MFCNNCGNKLNGNEEFCPNCGKRITKVQEPLKNKKNISKTIIAISIVLILIVVILLLVLNLVKKPNKYGNISKNDTIITIENENRIPKFIDGDFAGIKVESEKDALKALETIKDSLKIKNTSEELKIDYYETSENITYYRFNQMYKDIEVYNNQLIISADRNGKILSLSGYYIPNIDIDTDNKKTQEELEEIIKQDLGENSEIIESKKYIYADNEYQHLVFVISGYSDEKIKEYIIDANTGEIINSSDLFTYATYEFNGNGIDSIQQTVTIEEYYDLGTLKNRYRLVDPDRNIQIVDGRSGGTDLIGVISSGIFSSWTPMVGDLNGINFDYLTGQGDDKEIAEIGITALKQFEEIYDYYYNVLGRKSYDNNGSKIIVNVGVKAKTLSKEKLQNAAWLPLTNQMYIGYWNEKSFVISKDVLAHELTHGVISKTSNFSSSPKKEDKNKAFETGALDESYADILGSLIEGENWEINEKIETLRSLSNPNNYEMPSAKGEKYYFPDGYLNGRTIEEFLKDNNLPDIHSYDEGGVHHNATVVGHAAYLMYSNGAFKSKEEMAKVWYNSLFLLSSYSNFEDCALAVIKTAKNLGLSSETIRIIEEAFMETKMIEDKRIEVTGVVSSGEQTLENVKIEINSLKDKDIKYETTTDEEGNFSIKIASGTYEIKFSKEGFENFTTTITILGDATMRVELAAEKSNNNNKNNELKNMCTTDNCYNFTMYFMEGNSSDQLEENYQTFAVDSGTILEVDYMLDMFNKSFGSNFITSDGESFYMTMGDFEIEFAWYYKDTEIKYDWSKPINEDIEVEMKLFDGFLDNGTIGNIFDMFNK